jgi:hypothetical protein
MNNVDPVFSAVIDELFDGAIDSSELQHEITKMNPDGADMHIMGPLGAENKRKPKKKATRRYISKSGAAMPAMTGPMTTKEAKKRKQVANFGLAGNAVATAGGLHAMHLTLKNPSLPGIQRVKSFTNMSSNKHRKIFEEVKPKTAGIHRGKPTKINRAVITAGEKMAQIPGVKTVANNPKKVLAASAAGWAGLHGTELAADYVANRSIARDRRQAVAVLNRNKTKKISKNSDVFDVTWTGTISKVNKEKRQVFGWASVTHVDGQPVVDRQLDFMPLDELENAAYQYVIESRTGGDMHRRVSKAADAPVHVSDMIESFVVTPEKLVGMGLPGDAINPGWWVGYKINNDEQWELVKAGKRTGFSVHGAGKRTSKEI